jgi:hypothetical protein
MEKRTADMLMAYLAAVLGQHTSRKMDPITDSKECLDIFATIPEANGDIKAQKELIWSEIIAGILPAPVERVSPAKLAEFKERHRDLLRRFRTAIDDLVISIAMIPDPRWRAERVESSMKGLMMQRDEIIARMNEGRWRRIGLGALGAVVCGSIALADAILTGGMLTQASTSLGLVSAVYAAYGGARTPQELLARPMAYGALAQQRLA